MRKIVLSVEATALVDLLAGRCAGLPDCVVDDEAGRQRFVSLCEAHAVQHLVAGLLRDGAGGVVPEEQIPLVTALEAGMDERCALLMATESQLRALAEAMEGGNTPFWLLKGVALIGTVYRETPLRRLFGDADILVPEEHFDRTVELCEGLGYRLAEHKRDIEAVRRYGHKLFFIPPYGRGCGLDIHFRPLGKKLFEPTARIDCSVFRENTSECELAGRRFSVPAPELHLLYLCVHLSLQHHLASLGWQHDIRAFPAALPELDWDRFVELAGTCRVRRAVWLSLEAASRILDAEIPEGVTAALRPAEPGLLTRLWCASWLDPANIVAKTHHFRQRSLPGKAARMYSEVLLIDDDRERWSSVLKWFLPDPVFFRASYRVSGWWRLALCYLMHPVVVTAIVVMLAARSARYLVEYRTGSE